MLNYSKGESEARLSAVFDHAIDGIITIDERGLVESMNPAAARLFGYEPVEVLGKNIKMLMPEPDHSQHDQYLDNYHRTGHKKIIGIGREVKGLKKNGTQFPLYLSITETPFEGKMIFTGIIHDISELKLSQSKLKEYSEELETSNRELERRVIERTRDLARANEGLSYSNESLQKEIEERRQVERALRESQKLYKTIAKNFPDGILCVLDKSLKYLLIDGMENEPAMGQKEDWVGSYATSMNFIDQKDEFIKGLKQALTGLPLDMEMTVSDGAREYQVNAVPLYDDDDKIVNLLVVCKNITERKKAEKEILNALNKEKELNELKSRFVTTASHEFRTPLSTILSSASLIGRYVGETEVADKIEKHVMRIKSSVNNLTYILNDFLSLGKLEEGKTTFHPTIFDFEEFIEETISQIGPTLKKDQKIVVDPSSPVVGNVYADEQMIKNVLINLLNNASKYSDEGKSIRLSLTAKKNQLVFKVKDDGIGIPAKDQQHLFDRFFRANNAINIQGTGLGLNIVKKYIELMNGHIEFSSEENKGTEFKVSIPITQPSHD
ncbi:MAG: PAS domain S-box protein [Imperialibacter sp.]|uniref:PAS domain S-box protein n=1 Tax=Imperialibacter sp. TaxID=2038411 RepID=UPI0032EC8AB7